MGYAGQAVSQHAKHIQREMPKYLKEKPGSWMACEGAVGRSEKRCKNASGLCDTLCLTGTYMAPKDLKWYRKLKTPNAEEVATVLSCKKNITFKNVNSLNYLAYPKHYPGHHFA